MRSNSSQRRVEQRTGGSPGIPGYFSSPVRDEALARLTYIVEQRRPCGLLTGPAGTGKSELFRVLAKSLRTAGISNVATIDLRGVTSDEFVYLISAAWNLGPVADSVDRLWTEIRDHARGLSLCHTPTTLIIDHLDQAESCDKGLERLLSLAQRSSGTISLLFAARSAEGSVAARHVAELSDLKIEITPFDALETSRFVSHCLASAGGRVNAMQDPPTLLSIYRQTRGVAREIRRVCELLILAGAGQGKEAVSPQTIDGIAAELSVPGTPTFAPILV